VGLFNPNLIYEKEVSFAICDQIAKDTLGICFLGHGAVKRRMPRFVISFVAFPAVVRFKIAGRPARTPA
jgi:hypothetical protein